MTVLQLAPAPRHDRAADLAEPAPITALHQRVKDFDLSERAAERDAQFAMAAVLLADSVLTMSFSDTLDQVVPVMSWTGHPPLTDNGLPASAVTYLGSTDGSRGWWLHYTRRHDEQNEDGDLLHVLTLIAPCDCGAYTDVELVDEDALIVLLDELDTEPGAPVPCDYRLRIRRSSYLDPRHDSTEPPF
ncbi:hypothetical protein [Streptomyces sp. NPDC058674]|uniref:hypothetical protein n=1 Tax=Streptomyces sp. NPDC058674 TaxID=3346592 RepID=UPI00365099A0